MRISYCSGKDRYHHFWCSQKYLIETSRLQKHLISLGQDNGVIKDFDSKTQQVIRKATLHKSRINFMYSRSQYLISSCVEKVVIYDYVS